MCLVYDLNKVVLICMYIWQKILIRAVKVKTIIRRNATKKLNRNKTSHAKRNHFPLQLASALTVHKSQVGSYDEIVYYVFIIITIKNMI